MLSRHPQLVIPEARSAIRDLLLKVPLHLDGSRLSASLRPG
jgi:hypothetical protein